MERVLPNVTVFAGPMGASKTTRLYGVMGELAQMKIRHKAYRPGHDVRGAAETIAPKGYYIADMTSIPPNSESIESLEAIPIAQLVLQASRPAAPAARLLFGYARQRK